MNNSLNIEIYDDFAEKQPDVSLLREREAKLVRLIESFHALSESKEWSTLKEELFEGALQSIENRLKTEADKPEVSLPEIYRLQGERKWVKRYADPVSLVERYRIELAHIRKQINPSAPGV